MITARKLRLIGAMLLFALSGLLSSCEQPRVYGSVGYSSYSGGGYYGGGGFGTSISVGGRIY
ncbi:MAG: hypothetical protein GTO71_01260 [Woeseiaceae bacterium]|nr:hypothetical protein [Woeseiaceae bacterium]NIP19748.1 hypothetical protein [Woeseiaceae bacterium]NIS89865.1 hypothetical protein [Woeseiaceae bacterium]